METTRIAEKLVAEKYREEIEKIQACHYCGSSRYLGGVASPAPDGGKDRVIFCLNHKNGGVILSRFQFNPAQ